MTTDNEFLSLAKTDVRILMLGAYCTGKTTILDRLKSIPVDEVDNLGCQHVTRHYGSAKFTPLHVGGRCSTRDVYRNFLRNTDAVIYVVDEKEYMIPAVKEDLHGIFQDEWLEGVPLLVVANKKDLHPEHFTELLKDKLDLNELKGTCDWHIVAASALHSDEGLHEGLEWLDRAIHQQKSRAVMPKHMKKVKTGASDKSKLTTEKNMFEQFAKKSLASIKKLFLIN